MSLSRLVPLALRHLEAYRDIAEKDAQDAITALAGRVAVAMIAIGPSWPDTSCGAGRETRLSSSACGTSCTQIVI